MANRNFNRKQALDKEVKEIYAKVAIGSTGAPTLDAARSLGVASVARVSAGIYDVTLQDKYVALMQLSESVQLASGAPASLAVVIRSEAVDSTRVIRVAFVDSAGAAVELDNGSTIRLKLDLKNSSAR